MGTLLYLLLSAGFFFLMMRFGCGAHIMGHGHAHHDGMGGSTAPVDSALSGAPSKTQIDPVCTMSVDTATAKASNYNGKIFYFCSSEHRDAFEAAPGRYVNASRNAIPQPLKEHFHG